MNFKRTRKNIILKSNNKLQINAVNEIINSINNRKEAEQKSNLNCYVK